MVTGKPGRRLWRHPDFLRFWVGETVSQLGTQVTLLALPTVAILTLHAGAFQIGILRALEGLPFLLLSLVIGAWIDRVRRRRALIIADLGQALVLSSVPIAFLLHVLTLAQLYAVALIGGAFTVIFSVGYESYLPILVGRTDLIEGSTKLEVTSNSAYVAGPAIGGILIQAIGAALAIAADVSSYIVSIGALLLIRKQETVPDRPAAGGVGQFIGQIGEGLGVTFRNPIIRSLALTAATSNLGGNMFQAVFLLFAYRQLLLTPAEIGIVLGLGSVGGLVGALLASRLIRLVGLGRALFLVGVVEGGAVLGMPIARWGAPLLVITAMNLLLNLAEPTWMIGVSTLRQAVTPDHLRGRVVGSARTVVFGIAPIGSMLGGVLGIAIGLAPTILVGGALMVASSLWITSGPVIGLERLPAGSPTV